MNHKIHHLAVWVLVVIHFFIGLGWYALFGEAWLNYNARTMTDIEPPHSADRDRRRDCGQLRPGMAVRKTTCRSRPHRIEDRARLLVRVLVCPIREHLRVLSVRNKSLAAHSHQHGPSLSRLRH